MTRRTAAAVVTAGMLASGCGLASGSPTAGADVVVPTVTVTATATVTETVAPEPEPPAPGSPESVPGAGASAPASGSRPARLDLEVFEDGCGVVRSTPPGVEHQSLTWVFRDRDGFQVLGRNAAGEDRYRYHLPGTYTVVLEAFVGGRYVPVSNEVTVRC